MSKNKKTNSKKYFEEFNEKLRLKSIQWLLHFKHFKLKNSILIFSEARGGSTWLMELLSNIPKTIINWEPLHPDDGVIPKKFNFGWRPLLKPSDPTPEYKEIFQKVFRFQISSKWTRKYLSFKKLIFGKYVITKLVRGNLLLPYIIENFNLKVAPIFLIRHPIDISASRLIAFNQNQSIASKIQPPDCLNNERFKEQFEFLSQLRTDIEVEIALWCINNVQTINDSITMKKVIVVYYSDLLMDPKNELKKVMLKMNLNINIERILKSINFNEASSTNFKKQFRSNPEEQLFKNFNKLDDETKKRIQSIFDHFDFTLYNAYSPYPQKFT